MINLDPSLGSNFCYAPWTNIHIDTEGSYKTCCAGTAKIGDLRKNTIDDVINNSQLLDIKQSILNNQSHSNCQLCTEQEKHTSVSERNWYNSIAAQKVVPIRRIEDQSLQNLDIRWSNTCNLSCVYCFPNSSSVWAQLKNQPNNRFDYTDTLPNIIEHINRHRETIKNLGLLGGEPLLQKENESLLDVINDNVHINIITNLSVPLEKNKIFKQLVNMDNVVWDISFETVEDRFEYVRKGASWTTMLKNIKLLKDAVKDKPGHIIGITGQYTIYNCLNIGELLEYFVDNNLPHIRWNELIYPEILSPYQLPDLLMKLAVEQTKKGIDYAVKHHKSKVQENFWCRQADNLSKTSNPNANTILLYQWHKNQEQQFWPETKLKFEDLWPEFNY